MRLEHQHQEVLLFINTRFASMELQAVSDNRVAQSKVDKLKEACWNGLLDDVLPEISEDHANNRINLWNINVADKFLDLQYGVFPSLAEERTSVNPYMFMQHQHLN